MGSRASMHISEQQLSPTKEAKESDPHGAILARVAEVESKLKRYEAMEAKQDELDKRLGALEKELASLSGRLDRSPSQASNANSHVNSHLSVRSTTMKGDVDVVSSDGSLDPNPKESAAATAAEGSTPTQVRRRRIKKHRQYSIAPMNDIEAYGQGLNPHDVSKAYGSRNQRLKTSSSSKSTDCSTTPTGLGVSEQGTSDLAAAPRARGQLSKAASIDVVRNTEANDDRTLTGSAAN